MDDIERFNSKIKINDKTRCWMWKAGIFTNGYGVFKAQGKTWRAHRYSFTLSKGKIPKNKILHHKCENKLCVNPKHLQLITVLEHPKLSSKHNENKTHCNKGHPFSGSNLYINPKGKRVCKKCQKERRDDFLKKNPEKSKEYTYRWREKYPQKYNAYMAKYWASKT